eukprot:9940565-Ditylum_brightwellii.AAC.1
MEGYLDNMMVNGHQHCVGKYIKNTNNEKKEEPTPMAKSFALLAAVLNPHVSLAAALLNHK